MTVRIRYSCPHCERRIEHNAALAGQLVICSACMGEFYEPTDPLPGKSAQKALQPKPEEPRTVRVPVEMTGLDNQLAILSPKDAGGMQSIEQIVEAVLIDRPLGAPVNAPPPNATPISGSNDFGLPPMFQPAAQANRPAPAALPPSAAKAQAMQPTKPQQQQQRPVAPQPQQQRPAQAPQPAPIKTPIPAAGLAGVSAKQMIDELRRRGLFAVLVSSEVGNMQQQHLIHSENMTADDALSLLKKYLASQKTEDQKPAPSGILSRLFGEGKKE